MYCTSSPTTVNTFHSNAKPKIADYPFTTIVPNLGVCDLFETQLGDYLKQQQQQQKQLAGGEDAVTSSSDVVGPAPTAALVIADIPGLLEGAHAGVGLGLAFLRHVQRCR